MVNKLEKFIEKSKLKFGDKYNYDNFVYIDNLSYGFITCPSHGDFEVRPITHLSKSKYGGCKKCLKLQKAKKFYDRCKEVALNCETRGEFQIKYKNEYNISYRHDWLDDLCSHMVKIGNLYNRCIYVYEFIEYKTIYVGLTFNISVRDRQHKKNNSSQVNKFAKSKNIKIPKIKQLTEYIDIEKAIELEEDYITKYKNDGWFVLNKAKGGGLGGNKRDISYNKQNCFDIAKNYKSVSECEKENYKICQLIRQNKWTKEAFSHIFEKNKIVCFSLEGEFLKIYDNIKIASNVLKLNPSHISNCINQKAKFTKKYRFMRWLDWVRDGENKKLNNISLVPSNSKPVVKLTLDGEYVCEYDNIALAVRDLGKIKACYSSISKACSGKLKTAYGYKWEYK